MRGKIIGWLCGVGGVLAFWYGLHWSAVVRPRTASGAVRAVFFVDTPAGPQMLAVDAVESEESTDHQRLNLVSLQTGKRAAREVTDATRFLGQTGRALWFTGGSGDGELAARDASSLQVLVDEKALHAKNPHLAKGLNHPNGFTVTPDGRGLTVMTNDGYRATVDGTSFTATPLSAAPVDARASQQANPSREAPCANATAYSRLDGEVSIALKGDPRGSLTRNDTPVPTSSSYLKGALLEVGSQPSRVVKLTSPESVYVVHADSLTDARSLLVSRVRLADGKEEWTRTLTGQRELKCAHVADGGLVIVTTRGSSKVDKATRLAADKGGVIWEYEF